MKLPLQNPLHYRKLSLRMELLDTDAPTVVLSRPEAVAAFTAELLDSPQEVMLFIAVDHGKRVIGVQELSRGTADACIVHPRDVFRSAIALAPIVGGVFLVHNHPSGRCEPSDADSDFFEQVTEAGKLMHIPVLDCFVTAHDGYWSREAGHVRTPSSYQRELRGPAPEPFAVE